ncbi:MAG: hypothetical protein M3R13_01365 [Armatimonadota bacterium]|nr:hypothetical protein [Armatimonadota bacterium]
MKFATTAALLVALASLGFGQDAANVLNQAVRRQPTLSYRGERIVDVVVDGKPVRLVEIVSRNRERSRTTYPSDSPRKGFIVVETPRDRWEFNPLRNEVRRMPRRRGNGMMMLRGLAHAVQEGRLTSHLGTPETIAGRRATTVKVIDKKGEMLQRLSIDEATGMILKADQFGPQDRKLAGYVFVRIDYSPKFAENEFAPPKPPGAKTIDRPQDFDVDWKVRTPGWLPPNFEETGRGLRRFEGRPVVLLHYSDGRKNFSIFQGRGPRPPRLNRGGPKPAGFSESSMFADGLWFVGLGRVEKATIDRVLKSVR